MSKTIELDFDGYYREKDLPPSEHYCSGVYIVYAGEQTGVRKRYLRKLLYIGESIEAATRPNSEHENYQNWRDCLNDGEELHFSFADVKSIDRERTEAALIYHHQPFCNSKGKGSFCYQETHIVISGSGDHLDATFTEYMTP
jgi:hypothetical protein